MHLWLAALAAIALTPPPRLAKVVVLRSPPPSCNILDDVLSSKVAKRSRRMARKAQRSLVDEYEPETTDAFVELPIMFTNEREMQSFDHNRWRVHRSPGRYSRLLLGTFLGVTSRRISATVLALLIFSAAVDGYAKLAASDPNLPEFVLPLTPFELTAPVLGLLLVFRTNTAYERFNAGSDASWEVTGRFRSVVRQLVTCSAAPGVPAAELEAASELIDALLLLHCQIMNIYLRGGGGGAAGKQAELLRLILGCEIEPDETGPDESEHPTNAQTPWLGLSAVSYALVTRLPALGVNERLAVDVQITELTHSLGVCEKLLRTPIPLGYTRYSVRFLWLWLTLLPFALTNTFSQFGVGTWWENKPQPVVVLAMLFIGFIFLSIEDIAVQIEEPFSILPLEHHQAWLERDAGQMRRVLRHHARVAQRRDDGE